MKSLITLTITLVSLNLFAVNTTPMKKSPVYGKADYGHKQIGPQATICEGRGNASQDYVGTKGSANAQGDAVLHKND